MPTGIIVKRNDTTLGFGYAGISMMHLLLNEYEEKLAELAYDVSLLAREKVGFDYDRQGNLCLYWLPGPEFQAI